MKQSKSAKRNSNIRAAIVAAVAMAGSQAFAATGTWSGAAADGAAWGGPNWKRLRGGRCSWTT